MAGYGNWIYNREVREFKNPYLPRKWYIWRKMVYQNFILILVSSVIMGILLLLSLFDNLDDSLQISTGSISVIEDNIDPTLGIGLLMVAIIGFLLLLFLLFFLVLIPAIIAKVIRSKHEKKH
jgi:large-conductance mechanosensitive channel